MLKTDVHIPRHPTVDTNFPTKTVNIVNEEDLAVFHRVVRKRLILHKGTANVQRKSGMRIAEAWA